MDYSSTLNLPRTNFPMRAGLPKKEPTILESWDRLNLYEKCREKRKGAPKFLLHDGPPYANGDIHMGTALNKVLKDIINKYKFLRGFDVIYVPGWDTHGLPIEHQVIKTKKIKREDLPITEFRSLCRDYALGFLDSQRQQFIRLGVLGEWDDPYVTLDPAYEAVQIGVFGKMAEKGFIYKGLKPVYWCPHCETALAEAEIEYQERKSPSIYVKFPVVDAEGRWDKGGESVSVLIWTTTPWTIPANVAIAVHPDYIYCLAQTNKGRLLLARDMLKKVASDLDLQVENIDQEITGKELEGLRTRHPLFERESKVILADYVTLEQGSGCVHIAPGHGLEDYESGLEYDLPIFAPMDSKGVFTPEAGEFSGLRYDEGNKAVVQALDREKVLLDLSYITHQYPHCWRCKKEVIFRATEQWFASIEKFRDEALEAVDDVSWVPAWGQGRMKNMIADRRDWCISRQRVWGVPLPIFYCQDCGEAILTPESIAAVQKLFAKEGSDAWYSYSAEEILPQGTVCSSCGGKQFRKEQDIMDVWFDSGSSHEAVLTTRKDLYWPSDLYLEGSDQFRGWFQSSLLTAVAIKGKPPYRTVLSHGWVVDGEGKKMSKSLGNVLAPEDIIKNYGADLLRLWVSSADFTSDVHLSKEILKQLTEIYRKIRNTSRFLIGNCQDFDPTKDEVGYEQLEELDRWALHRLYKLVEKTSKAYDNFEFHQVFHDVHNFAVVDMSNFYLDIVKDRLYVLEKDSLSRRSVQTVLWNVWQTITLLVAPILSFTAEEIWSYLPAVEEKSVLLASWPELPPHFENGELAESWEVLLKLKEEVNRVLEKARREKFIGNSLQAEIELYPGKELYQQLQKYESILETILIVSSCHLRQPDFPAEKGSERAQELGQLSIKVKKAPGEKCQRCWMVSTTVSEDKDFPGVCDRCGDILKRQGIKPSA
ncbi:MAG TPA: isoleucine--tRNA ligase [Firmicutes bacterium]|nr:isoleucine--tRNA ligase [Bacillota bacterium]